MHLEYEQRLEQTPIQYTFQVQQKEVLPEHHSFSRDMFYFNAIWDEPWVNVGTIRIEGLLQGEEARKLSFNIANRPKWLKLPRSYSIDDYCSIAAFRTKMYPIFQPLRHLSYGMKKLIGTSYHYNHTTNTPPNSEGI